MKEEGTAVEIVDAFPAGVSDRELQWALALPATITSLSLSEEQQFLLASHPDVNVRYNLALHRDLLPEVQAFLATNPDPDAHYALATNPALIPSLQRVILEHEDPQSINTALLLAIRRDVTLEAQYLLSKRIWTLVHDALMKNRMLVWGDHLDGDFLQRHNPTMYGMLTRGVDREVLEGLRSNWSGTLRDLLELCALVHPAPLVS